MASGENKGLNIGVSKKKYREKGKIIGTIQGILKHLQQICGCVGLVIMQ